MMTHYTTTVDIRDIAYWPDEAQLAAFAEQADRGEKDDWLEQAEAPIESDSEYVMLYFGS